MVHVVESVKYGIHCGTKCATITQILAYFYLWISLSFTLVARLYLRAYYHSAHMAGLSVFVALFVISHHTFRIRRSLNCGYKAFNIFQCILNTWYMLASIAGGVCYAVLVAFGVTLNFDYVGALIWSFINAIFMVYLLILTGTATRGGWYSRYNLRGSDKDWVYYHHDKTPGSGSLDKNGEVAGSGTFPTMEKKKKTPASAGCCKTCLRVAWSIVFGFCYTIFQILFMVIIVLTVYHPATVIDDVIKYRNDEHMYTVEVDGHRPLALYMRCRGNGSETIVYENGLGGAADMEWDFLPKFLESDYTVCVHDRRGYGWSETWENDNLIQMFDDPQYAETNTKFFHALVEKAGIKTPFFYAGHSYGGYHLTWTALNYPKFIKGLIYLDSSHFSSARTSAASDQLKDLLEVVVNFQPLGLLRAAIDLKVLDYMEAFKSVGDFEDMADDTRDVFLAAARSGYYFTSFLRERLCYQGKCHGLGEVGEMLGEALHDKTIDIPVFVIDAGSFPSWFGDQLSQTFSAYNRTFGSYVTGASHETLVYSTKYTTKTANLINVFVQYVTGAIDLSEFDRQKTALEQDTTRDIADS